MFFAGIDAGSRAAKVVIIEDDSGGQPRVIARCSLQQGLNPGRTSDDLYRRLLDQSGINPGRVAMVVATGYGRASVAAANVTITEISCHAAGVRRLTPSARTVIEIGGQDSKLLHLAADGSVRDFVMNDRCAAGTGRFLEMVADRLSCDLGRLGELSTAAKEPAAISSMCAVFAETEVIGLLASGRPAGEIIAGVQAAVASRTAGMAAGAVQPIVFTGGVAMIAGMQRALADALGMDVIVPPEPQFTGALGAALLARARFAGRPGSGIPASK